MVNISQEKSAQETQSRGVGRGEGIKTTGRKLDAQKAAMGGCMTQGSNLFKDFSLRPQELEEV